MSLKPTILVVDDTVEIVDVLVHLLKESYRIKAATTGHRAIEITKGDDPPDLILLDIMMPELSGYEVCRELKANSTTRHIPIIFLTAKTGTEDERLGL